jgi:hypothetical protein
MNAGDKLREQIEAEAERQASERKETQGLNARIRLLTSERDKLRSQLSLIESLEGARHPHPKWLSPKTPAKGHHAIVNLLVTDTHFDEEVDPAQVDGINAYNREIAEMRLEKAFRSTVNLAKNYLAGVTYDGATLLLGGDIFSGNIHDELTRTNADTLFGSLLHWLGPMGAGIEMLAREFGRVHVVGVPGNHGRMTRKPIAKQRAADNLDWLLYRLLAREFAKDDRITWEIPTAADAHVKVYSVHHLLTHGDQFRGGSGISGAMAPLMLGAHRKSRRQMVAGRPYDYMVMGHWHQHAFLQAKGLVVGGCLKGYDEFAYVQNYEPEAPSQALWITTPEHGIGWGTRVLVQDRKAEGW